MRATITTDSERASVNERRTDGGRKLKESVGIIFVDRRGSWGVERYISFPKPPLLCTSSFSVPDHANAD
jgi:hypothetical protein